MSEPRAQLIPDGKGNAILQLGDKFLVIPPGRRPEDPIDVYATLAEAQAAIDPQPVEIIEQPIPVEPSIPTPLQPPLNDHHAHAWAFPAVKPPTEPSPSPRYGRIPRGAITGDET